MVDNNSKVDFGLTADDYAKHRAGFPDSFFDRLAARGVGWPGQVIVDLGTGTGTLARGFAQRGCAVIAIDPAEAMLEQARHLDKDVDVRVDYRVATAENTGLPDGCADVVTAGQCWHWFDRQAAAREARRVLRPHGVAVIAHFDWIPLIDNVVEATEKLILTHNPDWKLAGGSGLYPLWLRDLGEAGFRGIETFSYDLDVPYSHEDWCGRIRASAGVGASMTPQQVEVFDHDLKTLLQRSFPEQPLRVHHRIFAVIARSRHPGSW